MPLYTVANLTHVDGISHVSLDLVGRDWTISVWKRAGTVFRRPVETHMEEIIGDYRSIGNGDGDHAFAHASAPAAFDRNENYLEHIHIQMPDELDSVRLTRLIFMFVGFGYLPATEADAIRSFIINHVDRHNAGTLTDSADSSSEGQ